MGASRRQAAWVIAATVIITAGALIYVFATVPPRSQVISDAVRDAAGATVTDTVMATVMATVTVTETLVPPAAPVQIPAPVETPAAAPAPAPPVEPAPFPAEPETVHPGSFCDLAGATGVTDVGTDMVCTTTADDDRARWRSAG
jgi:hypothetical protein